jgi:ubiquinone/menaquinone biosynthesis C-methylase UbiE
MKGKSWYTDWFDTEYYHLLYSYRDEKEARSFLVRMQQFFELNNAKVLDAACGRGRHSSILHDLGFHTTGIDLSERNIGYAKRLEREGLQFIHGDIRYDIPKANYDLVVNLFTSFGYFNDEEQNQLALNSMCEGLVEGGRLLLDFLNVHQILAPVEQTDWQEEKRGSVRFLCRKRRDERFVYKDIKVVDGQAEMEFEERVRLYDLEDFKKMFKRIGVEVEAVFGDYTFANYNPEVSDRLILCIRS